MFGVGISGSIFLGWDGASGWSVFVYNKVKEVSFHLRIEDQEGM